MSTSHPVKAWKHDRKTWKTKFASSMVVLFALACLAAAYTPPLSGAASSLDVASAALAKKMASPALQPFLEDARVYLKVPPTRNVASEYAVALSELKRSTALQPQKVLVGQRDLAQLRTALFSVRADCIKEPLKFTDFVAKTHSSESNLFREDVSASYSSLQDDCMEAQSVHLQNKNREQIQAHALTAYSTYKNALSENFNVFALDHLEKSYLAYVHLAITERDPVLKKEYYYVVGFLGLRLWNLNRDDAALLPLLILAADRTSSQISRSAWLLLKNHLQFTYSGSAGEQIPEEWRQILISIEKQN